ncbi:MAG: hypothetical protein B7Z78_06515 [Rhodospirillales bacterium 20-60-12]|nr:MAG: hypothetical protein B7Z78_06515 [Rhodospirillales bacterium 20-60-12]HQT68563.1 DUF4089 domain-containing protein [Acetobacteraceae bacterium]HQU01553.1 DUF4089 domain-containing protein [Acetobacteraceae bacterium]
MTDPIAAYVDAATALRGVSLAPDQRGEIIAAMALTMEQIAIIHTFPLPHDIEPAPAFLP